VFLLGLGVDVQRLIERHFALATIAARAASLAKVHFTGVFGAEPANSGGFLLTDAATKRH
jgi:hypothetical protein